MGGIIAAEHGVGFFGRNFADVNVTPADFAAVCLQLDRTVVEEGP